MRIHTFPTPQSIVDPDETIRGRFAVVIDALRATTVMAAALSAGASHIVPVAEVEEARRIFAGLPTGEALLCGERSGGKLPGFHLGNSPLEYTPEAVRGKTLVMTTTNGTRAILSCAGAGKLALGAIVNAQTTGRAAAASGMDIAVVCAGTGGFFTLEDMLAAGAILNASLLPEDGMDDLSRVALYLYRRNASDLAGALKDCAHARYLCQLGYARDVEYCMELDTLIVVPYFINGKIGLRP